MAEYLTEMDEAELIQNLIKAKAGDYYLLSLINESNIRTKPVGFCHEVPAIHIIKTGGSEENVLGDTMAGGKGNFQMSTILITVITRRNITKTYNSVNYEGVALCKKIRDIVKQIMFDNHSYYNAGFPNTEFILENMTSDSDVKGIQSYGALFTSELRYSVTFEINR